MFKIYYNEKCKESMTELDMLKYSELISQFHIIWRHKTR